MSTSVIQLDDSPLAKFHLSRMRDAESSTETFRLHLESLASVLAVEAASLLEFSDEQVQTPLAMAPSNQLSGDCYLVPILRAALGMMPAFERLMPFANTAHLGLKRNEETHEAECYYQNFPANLQGAQVLVLDPMLATGGSAIAAVDEVQRCGGRVMGFVCCVAAPEGISALQKAHPDLKIVAAAVDEGLNENAYIVPGLGDAGDRCFGTE